MKRGFCTQANPAGFTPPWNTTYSGIELVPTEPACGCGYIRNHEQIEGKIALIERGDCSFVSKVCSYEEIDRDVLSRRKSA